MSNVSACHLSRGPANTQLQLQLRLQCWPASGAASSANLSLAWQTTWQPCGVPGIDWFTCSPEDKFGMRTKGNDDDNDIDMSSIMRRENFALIERELLIVVASFLAFLAGP